MKVSFVLECQADGPDEKVVRGLLAKFRPEIEPAFAALGNKRNGMKESGEAAKQLLSDGCAHVVILWDLHPAEWGEDVKSKQPVCLHNDRELVKALLTKGEVFGDRAHLVAIEFMLESWLLADAKAIAAFLSARMRQTITAQQVGTHKPAKFKAPKDVLSKIFEQHRCPRYRDHTDAERIAQEITDIAVLRKQCPTFDRFWVKTTVL